MMSKYASHVVTPVSLETKKLIHLVMFFTGKLSAEEKEWRKKQVQEDMRRQQETKKRKKLSSEDVVDVEDDVPLPPPLPRAVPRALKISDASASTPPPSKKKKVAEEAAKPAVKVKKPQAKAANVPPKGSWEENFTPAEKEAFSFTFPPGASTTKAGWPVVFPAVSQLPLPFDRAAFDSMPGDDDVYQATRKAFWVSTWLVNIIIPLRNLS